MISMKKKYETESASHFFNRNFRTQIILVYVARPKFGLESRDRINS